MVWSQYVYEATHGYDVDVSDSDDAAQAAAPRHTIHDFQEMYSDELWQLFDAMNTLIHDAFLEYDITPSFSDFVELCYFQFEDSTNPYEDFVYRTHAEYILRQLKALDWQHLIKEVTLDDFIRFLKIKYP